MATSVMLLDCARLRHWQVEKQFGEATLDSVLERIQAQIAQDAVWVADDSGLRVTH